MRPFQSLRRVAGKPASERPMPGTPETSGGEAEREVYMLQCIILLVIELKLAFKDEMEHVQVAQVVFQDNK